MPLRQPGVPPMGARAALSNDQNQNMIQFYTTCTVGDTFDPSVTLVTGCPYIPVWYFGDSTTATGINASHTTYADAGPHLVTMYLPDVQIWLKTIDVGLDKISGDFLSAIAHCTALTSITTYVNPSMTGDVALLAGLTNLTYIDLSSCAITGNLSGFSGLTGLTTMIMGGNTSLAGNLSSLSALTSLTTLSLDSTAVVGNLSSLSALTALTTLDLDTSAVAGNISSLAGATGMINLQLYTSSVTGDVGDLSAMTALDHLVLDDTLVSAGTISFAPAIHHFGVANCGWSQANVDALLLDVYTNRAAFTDTTGHHIAIGGTNAAPSGTYADEDPPTTGKGMIYELVNDPETEGFNKWAITYTA